MTGASPDANGNGAHGHPAAATSLHRLVETADRGSDRSWLDLEEAPDTSRKNVGSVSRSEVAFILEEDPDLAQGLSPEDRRRASQLLRAPVITVEPGSWEPPVYNAQRTFGLLVLEGLMGRRVQMGEGVALELLSSGDILRPWDQPFEFNLIPPEVGWRVFVPSRLAILDERVTSVIGARPELVVAFSSRLLRRSRASACLRAISHLNLVEERLLAMLWHFASGWGRVTPQGFKVPFRLTHGVLAEVIGARRPSVTLAMKRLQQREEIVRAPDGSYVLTGDPEHWTRLVEQAGLPHLQATHQDQ